MQLKDYHHKKLCTSTPFNFLNGAVKILLMKESLYLITRYFERIETSAVKVNLSDVMAK